MTIATCLYVIHHAYYYLPGIVYLVWLVYHLLSVHHLPFLIEISVEMFTTVNKLLNVTGLIVFFV